MQREIKLTGSEISVLKMIGLSGSPVAGRMLIDRAGEMAESEFLDTLVGLIEQGFVLTTKVNLRLIEDVERAAFRVNPAEAKDLREAVNPNRRRERQRDRRQRRS
jgi:hypothetical protein